MRICQRRPRGDDDAEIRIVDNNDHHRLRNDFRNWFFKTEFAIIVVAIIVAFRYCSFYVDRIVT
jgi:hypothetical protein